MSTQTPVATEFAYRKRSAADPLGNAVTLATGVGGSALRLAEGSRGDRHPSHRRVDCQRRRRRSVRRDSAVHRCATEDRRPHPQSSRRRAARTSRSGPRLLPGWRRQRYHLPPHPRPVEGHQRHPRSGRRRPRRRPEPSKGQLPQIRGHRNLFRQWIFGPTSHRCRWSEGQGARQREPGQVQPGSNKPTGAKPGGAVVKAIDNQVKALDKQVEPSVKTFEAASRT